MKLKIVEKDIFRKAQVKIAKKTLNMPDEILNVIGGMTKDEAKQVLKRKKKKVKESKIYGSSTSFTHADVAKIAQKIDFDIIDACDFCLQLLEDVNAHDLMARVEEVLENHPMFKNVDEDEDINLENDLF